MNDQNEFNFSGEDLRDIGIRKVIDSNEPWIVKARVAAEQYIQSNDDEFTGEDIRIYCTKIVGSPNHPNAWGALVHGLVRKGLIQFNGKVTKMKIPSSHARKSLLYSRVK